MSSWIPFDFPDAPAPVKPVYATDKELADEVPSFDVSTTTKYGVDVAKVSETKPKQIDHRGLRRAAGHGCGAQDRRHVHQQLSRGPAVGSNVCDARRRRPPV